MKETQETTPEEKPIVEYMFVEEESGILDAIYDKLFEHIEKETRKQI